MQESDREAILKNLKYRYSIPSHPLYRPTGSAALLDLIQKKIATQVEDAVKKIYEKTNGPIGYVIHPSTQVCGHAPLVFIQINDRRFDIDYYTMSSYTVTMVSSRCYEFLGMLDEIDLSLTLEKAYMRYRTPGNDWCSWPIREEYVKTVQHDASLENGAAWQIKLLNIELTKLKNATGIADPSDIDTNNEIWNGIIRDINKSVDVDVRIEVWKDEEIRVKMSFLDETQKQQLAYAKAKIAQNHLIDRMQVILNKIKILEAFNTYVACAGYFGEPPLKKAQ